MCFIYILDIIQFKKEKYILEQNKVKWIILILSMKKMINNLL